MYGIVPQGCISLGEALDLIATAMKVPGWRGWSREVHIFHQVLILWTGDQQVGNEDALQAAIEDSEQVRNVIVHAMKLFPGTPPMQEDAVPTLVIGSDGNPILIPVGEWRRAGTLQLFVRRQWSPSYGDPALEIFVRRRELVEALAQGSEATDGVIVHAETEKHLSGAAEDVATSYRSDRSDSIGGGKCRREESGRISGAERRWATTGNISCIYSSIGATTRPAHSSLTARKNRRGGWRQTFEPHGAIGLIHCRRHRSHYQVFRTASLRCGTLWQKPSRSWWTNQHLSDGSAPVGRFVAGLFLVVWPVSIALSVWKITKALAGNWPV
jgi:hypothetical protein